VTLIRLADVSDAAQIQAIYAPIVERTVISFEEEPPDRAAMAARIRDVIDAGLPWLVHERDGGVTGYAYATRHRERAAYRWCVEVSVYIHERHRRQGIAHGLYASLLSVLQLLGYRNVYAGITLPNDASVRLHEALQFEKIGVYPRIGFKMGEWRDVAWYGQELMPPTAPPPTLRSVQEVNSGADWQDALRAGEANIRSERDAL
jgi:phosphinothricin acetyltransferase